MAATDTLEYLYELTLLNITEDFAQNCQPTSDYLTRLLEIPDLTRKVWDQDVQAIDLSSSYPYIELINLIHSLPQTQSANLSAATIVGWVNQLDEKLPIEWLQKFLGINFDGYWSDIECHQEVCEKLDWEGNADLVGVGMVVSYIVEMALATGFVLGFAFILSARALKDGSDIRPNLLIDLKQGPRARFSNPLHTSVGIFWDTAAMFALTITVAGLTVTWNNSSSYYTMFLASLSSNLATSVIVVIWPLYLPTCRHLTIRWAIISLVCVANMTIATSYWLIGPDSATRTRDIHLSYEWTCLSMGVHHGIEFWPNAVLLAPAFIASLIPMALLTKFILVFFTGVQRELGGLLTPTSDTPPSKTISIATLYILPGICVSMFTLMWISLVFLLKHRKIVAEVAGPSLQEGSWSFGQILALATWLPTIVDFTVVWKGHIKMITYRLPRGIDILPIVEDKSEISYKNKSSYSDAMGCFLPAYPFPTFKS